MREFNNGYVPEIGFKLLYIYKYKSGEKVEFDIQALHFIGSDVFVYRWI